MKKAHLLCLSFHKIARSILGTHKALKNKKLFRLVLIYFYLFELKSSNILVTFFSCHVKQATNHHKRAPEATKLAPLNEKK